MDSDVQNGDDGPEGSHSSFWLATTPGTSYDGLDASEGLDVDTVVVGGGIVGLTTAVELKEAGQSVALLERDRVVTGTTGHTTAKLTSLHGLIYDRLVDEFGADRARQYAAANEAAIDHVQETIERHGIDCDFKRAPAYTYTESPEQVDRIRDEVESATRLGLPASFVESLPLPFDVEAAVRFDDQAQFHPREYLLALAREVPGDGSHLFEETTVKNIENGDPCRIETDRGTLTASDVVVATLFPIYDRALYFARLEPKRSYVLAARLTGEAPAGMYYDPSEPYFSVRPRPGGNEDMVLIGGRNHRTGHGGDTTEQYRQLERQARDRFDVESIEHRWSTQDFVSIDGVPFVGRHSPRTDHVYVATGFGGWGMTGGTAAGRLLSDLVTGRENASSRLYRPTRLDVGASASRLISHNRHAMRHYLEDYVTDRPQTERLRLDPGAATVTRTDDGPVAVYRDEDGEYHAVSAVCSHMGCLVEWNDAEDSWDCPCHGSRFDADGTVLDPPATDDLSDRSYPGEQTRR